MGEGDGVARVDGMGEDEGEQCMCEEMVCVMTTTMLLSSQTQAISHKPSSPSPFLLGEGEGKEGL